jgi:hypothetical protein
MLVYPTASQKVCPVVTQAELVLESSKSLRAAVNKLRRDMRACMECPDFGQFAAMIKLNHDIDAAIDALATEWGLV